MHRVGLLVFSEGWTREDVYRQRKPVQDRETNRFIEALKPDVEFVTPSCGEIRGKRDVRSAVAEVESAGVSAVVLFIPIFISPAMVALAARLAEKPVILAGNMAADSFSQLAVLASGGAIDQAGSSCVRIPGDISEPAMREEILGRLKAIDVTRQLSGSTFGCIGGRSLGISTGVADAALWQKLFGVDVEHVDQYEIVLRARDVDPNRVALFTEWIAGQYGAICYKEGRFDEQRLDLMVRSYLATRGIIDHYELDFLGVKCQPEMSNGFVLQCLSVQLLNDPYDAEGFKEPIACSCEADNDGALTMQILKLVSDGRPTALQDVFLINDSQLVAANCGSMASYFAGLSDNAAENLREVHLQPHGFGQAGGAATQFVCAEDTMTYARLMRRDGAYWMAVLTGRTEKRPREALSDYSWYRPTSFTRISIDSDRFMREYGSNHIHCVRGDYVRDLEAFCQRVGIPCTIY